MDEKALVLRELSLDIGELPQGMRSLTVDLCRMSMGELLVLAEQVEAMAHPNAKVVRQLFNRRRDCETLRNTLANLKKAEGCTC